MRWAGESSSASRRSSDSARWAPRFEASTACTSSTITVSTPRSDSRAAEVSSRNRDSGRGDEHVGRGAVEAAPLVGRGVAGAGADGDVAAPGSPSRWRGLAQPGQRRAQVALDVDRQGLHRGDVEDPAAALRLLGHRGGGQPVQRPEERGERLARAGGRDDQRVLAVGDRLPRARPARPSASRTRRRTSRAWRGRSARARPRERSRPHGALGVRQPPALSVGAGRTTSAAAPRARRPGPARRPRPRATPDPRSAGRSGDPSSRGSTPTTVGDPARAPVRIRCRPYPRTGASDPLPAAHGRRVRCGARRVDQLRPRVLRARRPDGRGGPRGRCRAARRLAGGLRRVRGARRTPVTTTADDPGVSPWGIEHLFVYAERPSRSSTAAPTARSVHSRTPPAPRCRTPGLASAHEPGPSAGPPPVPRGNPECRRHRTATRRSSSRSRRSTSSSARARSCAWATRAARRSRSSPPARSPSTSPSASAACPAAGSSRSTARSPPARRPWRCTRWPTPRRAGGIAAFIDAEHALDPEYAKALGVDTDALLVSQPDTGEQALEIADMLIRSGALDIIVIDSVAALVPRAEIEGEMGDSHVGLQARLDEPGAAQDHRRAQPLEHHGDLHQPAAREDRRDVRLARRPRPVARR